MLLGANMTSVMSDKKIFTKCTVKMFYIIRPISVNCLFKREA